jgi:hypothetical protein
VTKVQPTLSTTWLGRAKERTTTISNNTNSNNNRKVNMQGINVASLTPPLN